MCSMSPDPTSPTSSATEGGPTAQQQLDNLADALIEDILALSDEEILAEYVEDGGDPEELAARMRAMAELSIIRTAPEGPGHITVKALSDVFKLLERRAELWAGELVYQVWVPYVDYQEWWNRQPAMRKKMARLARRMR